MSDNNTSTSAFSVTKSSNKPPLSSNHTQKPKLSFAVPENPSASSNNNKATPLRATPQQQQQQQQEAPPQDRGTLRHMSYSCPGLTGGGSSNATHIEALPFSFVFGYPKQDHQQLFENCDKFCSENNNNNNDDDNSSSATTTSTIPIWKCNSFPFRSIHCGNDMKNAPNRNVIIPLYQRCYCWLPEQGEKWFTDCISKFGKFGFGEEFPESEKVISRHGTGKIIIKKLGAATAASTTSTNNNTATASACSTTSADTTTTSSSSSSSTFSDDSWICIDGQQRVTTMSILFAALYNCNFDIKKEIQNDLSQCQREISTPKSEIESIHQECEKSLQILEEMMFVNSQKVHEWCSEQAKKIISSCVSCFENSATTTTQEQEQKKSKENNNKTEKKRIEIEINEQETYSEGLRINSVRVVPSHVDRSPFYEILTRRLLCEKIQQEVNNNNNNNNSRNNNENSNNNEMNHYFDFDLEKQKLFGKETLSTFQGKMFQVFIGRCKNWIQSKAASVIPQNAPNREFLKQQCIIIQKFVFHLVDGISFVIVEVLNDSSIAQIFLWLQEKSLLGMGALLMNNAPGIDFCASDLVRNLLLAPFMGKSLEEQEFVHKTVWLEPIEKKIRNALLNFRMKHEKLIENARSEILEKSKSHNTKNTNKNKTSAQDHQDQDQDEDDDEYDEVQKQKRFKLHQMLPTQPTIDHCTRMLIEQLEQEQLREKRTLNVFKSVFQQQVETMILHIGHIIEGKKDLAGLQTYMRFYSLFEYHLGKIQQKQKQEKHNNNNNKTQEDEEETETIEQQELEVCDFFSNKLAEITPKFIEQLESGEWLEKQMENKLQRKEEDHPWLKMLAQQTDNSLLSNALNKSNNKNNNSSSNSSGVAASAAAVRQRE